MLSLKYQNKFIYLIILLLIIPAYLYHLGYMPLIEDEAIRALVALEMILSQNYITPTLGGEYYFNKPPLYNWIITIFFNLTRDYSEFTFRLPSVTSLLLYALSIYYLTKQFMGKKYAFINALAFITCGRILFYDSLLGLIDITYSWITYLSFMCIFYCYRMNKIRFMFITVYFLSAIGFLMKGLPSVVFVGISLVAFTLDNKIFKQLFTWAHVWGILIFVLIISTYYYAYELYNPGSLQTIFSTLFGESSKRTALDTGILTMFAHIIRFPFEFIMHFLPWSILVIVLFNKNFRKRLQENPFIRFNVIIFLSNIVVYWVSPNIHPRYLFMLVPLFYTTIIHEYSRLDEQHKLKKMIHIIFLSFMVLVTIASLFYPFIKQTKNIEFILPITILLFISLSSLTYLCYKKNNLRLLSVIIFLLIVRIQFNYVILNVRSSAWVFKCREDALMVGQQTKDRNVYMYNGINIEGFEDNKLLNYQSMYYITRERQQILENKGYSLSNNLYITFDKYLKGRKYIHHYDLRIRHDKKTAKVVELIE